MKVFFSATYQGDKEYGSFYSKIYDAVKQLGYEHIDDPYMTMPYEEFLKEMDSGRDAHVNNYNLKIDSIKAADICIFETSYHSLGIGFMVLQAIELGKPTIVLYYKDKVPYFFSGVADDKLIVRSYTEKNIKKVVGEALEIAREKRDKRFNFFISPKLLDYLEKASHTEGVTKSKFIRNLIVEHMRETKKDAE